MKYKKIKAISLTLASALVSAGLGGALLAKNVTADEAAKYSLSDLFVDTNASIDAKTVGTDSVTTFTLKEAANNDGKVQMKNSLALKWFAEEGEENAKVVTEKYFTTTFALSDLGASTVSFTMQAQSAWAVKDSRSENTVKFAKVSDTELSVSVNGDTATTIAYITGAKLTLSFGAGTEDGQFKVFVNNTEVGAFNNIGANFAEYTVGKQYPFAFSADIPAPAAGATAQDVLVYLYDINGQQFNALEDAKVVDNAAPVLVVNEDINSFLLGAAFSLDYTVIDVLKTKNLTKDLEYYQYNPNVLATDEAYEKFKDLSTAVYFLETTAYVKNDEYVAKGTEGATKTTVFAYEEEKNPGQGAEYVSIKLNAGDGSKYADYNLAWYAKAEAKETKGNLTYIKVNKSATGATYKVLEDVNTVTENTQTANYADLCDNYNTQLQNVADKTAIGQQFKFPSMAWLFEDDNGYRNLKFTVAYKTESGKTSTVPGLLSNGVQFEIEEEGMYQVRVFAVDKAGNAMKYYDEDGELVDVTTSNVWDIENLPTFTFTINNQPLTVKDPTSATSRRETKTLDQTYTLPSFTIEGAKDVNKAYKLYKVDLTKYVTSEAGKASGKILSRSDLWAVSYEELKNNVDLTKVNDEKYNGDYFELYLWAYATELANVIDATTEEDIKAIRDCFTVIEEYNSRITEENDKDAWNTSNKYKWNADTQTFETVAEGEYLIMADFADQELPLRDRAAAYKVIVVDSKADVIEGSSDWLKNNLVSVILFSFAGVCLIALIVLLLVKPSGETLEDIDEQAAKKSNKSDKEEK